MEEALKLRCARKQVNSYGLQKHVNCHATYSVLLKHSQLFKKVIKITGNANRKCVLKNLFAVSFGLCFKCMLNMREQDEKG
jgi:hypothetical protein